MGLNDRRGIPYVGRVLVTGDRGFLASHILPELEKRWKFADIVKVQGTSFFDLTKANHVSTMFNNIESNEGPIRTVIHLAAKSGGILENIEAQASFWYQNMMMGINMLEECAKPNRVVEKLVMFLGGCSYPLIEGKETPYTEDEFWNGLPVETSLGYSFAKKSLIVGAWAYKKQFGLKTIFLMPTNLIGEFDNVNEKQSHVPMALIRRFVEAKEEGYDTVTVYGQPGVTRDFLYAGDFGKLFIDILQNFDDLGPLHISTGVGTTIEELAVAIKNATGFQGKIHFDKTKTSGQMHKVLDNTKLLEILEKAGIEWEPTSVPEAIEKTVDWYYKRVFKK